MRTPKTTTDSILALVEALGSLEWPDPAVDAIQSAYADAIACTVVGSTTEAGRIAADMVRETVGEGDATVLGTPSRAPAADAALVNGTAARALDYDDMVGEFGCASAALVPAILAAAEVHGASGEQLISAYGTGFEITSRILHFLDPPSVDRRWRSGSTIGVLGATAAVAALIRAEPTVLRNALGIAASTLSGSRSGMGANVNQVDAGLAAHNAILAMELARRGFVADTNAVDGENGLLRLYPGDSAPRADLRDLMATDRPLSIVETGLTMKRFASCRASHSAVDGIVELRRLHRKLGDPDNVVSIEARVNRLAAQMLFQHTAKTGDQGRFSLEYSLAVALIDGWLGVAQLSNERVVRPDVQALSSRVQMVVDLDAGGDIANSPVRVLVRLKDGTVLRTSVQRPKGVPGNPLDASDLLRKFRDCCEPVLGESNASRALEMLADLKSLPHVRRLTSALAAGK